MSEVPTVPGIDKTRGLSDDAPGGREPIPSRVAAAFAEDGPLARTISNFEPRQGQVEMADAVARIFDEGGVLLAEAGTGTGKTVAYLVPAILSRQRVLISTGTKNLQEQIFLKDVPALQQALGVPFTATCMKGRANYLCVHRLDQVAHETAHAGHAVFLPIIREWAEHTDTGDRAELADLPEDLPLWNDVAATPETCLGTECPQYDECFVTRMRQRAAAADVVIVNHHLLCADAAVRQHAFGEVIPQCSHTIVDEAHQLEDVATQYFGYAVSTYRLANLARDVERLARNISGGFRQDAAEALAKSVERFRDRSRIFFTELVQATARPVAKREDRVRVTDGTLADAQEAAGWLIGVLDDLEASLMLLPQQAPEGIGDASGQDRQTLAGRAREVRDDLRFLLKAGDPDYVYFVECRGRGVFLRASPIDVSTIVRELLLDRMRSTVLTSATLTVDGTFEYVRGRLGIGKAVELCLASEFDYERQTLLYLPPRMPDPRSPEFSLAAGREVVEILRRTRGRAFVLFTSYATLRAVQSVAEMALEYPILVQGTAPRNHLLTQFRETPHAVLFGTSSFWQGVDVVGEALSCVIIDKLPFASPGDPVTGARIDAIRARGGEPFSEYQVPLAILTLQQGLGRLIRHRRDRGVMAVLDPRLRTKGYGRRFLASLPPAQVVHNLEAVEAFLQIV